MNSGIYKISSPSGKFYIGSAQNFSKRWSTHLAMLRGGKHHNRPLQSAFSKYGEGAIKFAKIVVCEEKDLLTYEQICIDGLRPAYNICKTAGNCAGRGISEAGRESLRKHMTGRKVSEETRAKLSASRKGVPIPEAQRRKMSDAAKGRKKSPEHRLAIANGRRGEKSGRAKLTWEIIRSIRKDFKDANGVRGTQKSLSTKYGLSTGYINRIVKNSIWTE